MRSSTLVTDLTEKSKILTTINTSVSNDMGNYSYRTPRLTMHTLQIAPPHLFIYVLFVFPGCHCCSP